MIVAKKQFKLFALVAVAAFPVACPPSALLTDLQKLEKTNGSGGGGYVYVTNQDDGTVSAYTIGSGGALTELGPPITSGSGPMDIAIDPKGNYAYVTNGGGGTVQAFTIGSGGALSVLGSPFSSTGSGPWGIVVDPTGKYA